MRLPAEISPELELEARAWVADCHWREDELEPGRDWLAELSTAALVRGIDRRYAGGWRAFVAEVGS